MKRREFLGSAAAAAAFWTDMAKAAEPLADIPIIDTHVHLFDSRRPQGVPYAGSPEWAKEHNGVALPSTYRAYAVPLNIVGAIELEASPWIEDNLWVLEQEHSDPLFVGTVGDLEPEKPDFADQLARFRKDPLFLGIRCGNIWNREVSKQVNDPKFIDGLKRVADADLVMDSANPTVELLQTMVKINDKVPSLRIMIDHLPQLDPTPQEEAGYKAVLKEIHGRPKIYAKLSEIDHRSMKERGLAAHKARLDQLMDAFGEDRVVFGSDWPNSWGTATPAQIVSIARAYFATRSRAAAEKYFWKNSLNFYKWKKRAKNQPSLVTPPLTRRAATDADAAVIVGWFPSWRDAVWWGGPTVSDPLTAEWLVAQFAGGAFRVWTDRDNVIQAMAGLKAMSDGTAYLNRFGIAPAMRGKGLSAKLMAELIGIARVRGDTAMSLWVYGSNTIARRVYERLGFGIVTQRDAAEDASGVSINMRLEFA